MTQSLRKSVTVDWAVHDTVRAKSRVMVKTLLKRYKCPPDKQEEATETVVKQAESLSPDMGGGLTARVLVEFQRKLVEFRGSDKWI